VASGDQVLFQGKVSRTIGSLAATLGDRGDPSAMFSAQVPIAIQRL
jgi:hypothetical protein